MAQLASPSLQDTMTIDMKDYAGELNDSAAESQQVGANSYIQETQPEEVPVHQELLEQAQAASLEEVPQTPSEEPTKQELNFKALREEIDRLKTERESERQEFRQNLDLLRANAQQQQPLPPPTEPKKFLDGMGDNDVPNVAEIRRALEQREADYQSRIEELQVAQMHPDYAEVLEKFTGPLLRQKPHLAQGIRGADNKALFAYELGKMAQQLQPAPVQQTQPSATAQRIVENARKPATLAQAGGQSVLSKADYFASMSDAEFMKMASKNLGEI